MINRLKAIVICFAAILPRAGAQGLSLELNGGLQGMRYTLQNGETKLLPGFSLGVGYGFRLSQNFNLLSGVSGGVYRTKATLRDGVVYSSYQVDDAGSAFEYSVKTTGYQETQQFFALGVPLMVQYHTTDPGAQWYFNAGGKVFVPFNTSIQVSADKAVFSGYYPDFNINVANLPQHGFGTVNGWKADASTNLKPSAALSAATGASFSLSPDLRLYAGVYVDYGLTDIKGKNDTMSLVSYNPGGVSGIKAGSVINGAGAGKANLLAYGLQVRLSFGGSKPKAAGKSRAKEAAQPATTDTISTDQYDLIVRPVIFGLIGETGLPDIQQKHLDEVVAVLKLFPNIRISVVGHFCNSETEVEDRRVGQERARAVAQYLQSKGIGAGRMKVTWMNESDEMVPYNPIANYRSRRVVITVE